MYNTSRIGKTPNLAIPQNSAQGGNVDPAPDKFILKNNIKKINPEWKAWQQRQLVSPTVSAEDRPPRIVAEYQQPEAMAVYSTPEDIAAAQKIHTGNYEFKTTECVQDSREMLDEAAGLFGIPSLNGEELEAGLFGTFAKWQAPIGYINKLMKLADFRNENKPHEAGLQWLIDDSGSMTLQSDVKNEMGWTMSRFEEAEQRLSNYMEFLQWIPTGPIKIQFLNRSKVIDLQRPQGQSPEQFLKDARRQIRDAFADKPGAFDLTPIHDRLQAMLNDGQQKKAIYLEFDGRPQSKNDPVETQIPRVKDLVLNRIDAENHPISLISCTDKDHEVAWAKDLEEAAPFTSESDDFVKEKEEVEHDQGKIFPYTPGMWMLAQLCAAMWPDDLDALDEKYPMTRFTLENLMGAPVDDAAYAQYFQHFERKDPQWRGEFGNFNVTERTNERDLPFGTAGLVANGLPKVQAMRAQDRARVQNEIDSQMGRGRNSSMQNNLVNQFGAMNFGSPSHSSYGSAIPQPRYPTQQQYPSQQYSGSTRPAQSSTFQSSSSQHYPPMPPAYSPYQPSSSTPQNQDERNHGFRKGLRNMFGKKPNS